MTTDRTAAPSLKSLILIPSLITLAITILRLVGELQNWSPTFFSRAAGGAGAVVGIVWLVPVFGAWFAVKVTKNQGVHFGVFLVAAVVAGAIAYRGWPALGRVLLAYGLAARIPVAVVMLIAIYANWGTHYDVAPPNMAATAPLTKWFMIGLVPQVLGWIPFTICVGALFGGIALLAVGGRREVPV